MSRTIIKSPAFIRRRYKDEWEYQLLLADGTYSPCGVMAPSEVRWVYQVTWKGELQRVHVVRNEDRYNLGDESKCWWETMPNTLGLAEVLKVHSQPWEQKK